MPEKGIKIRNPMSKKRKPNGLTLEVKTGSGLAISQANITLKGPSGQLKLSAQDLQDPQKLSSLSPGKYTITVQAKGFLTEVREIEIGDQPQLEPFFLGKKGQRAFYKGKVKYPVDAPDHQIGVQLASKEDRKGFEQWLKREARKLRISPPKVQYSKTGSLIELKLPPTSSRLKKALLSRIRNRKEVSSAGPKVELNPDSLSFLTQQLFVIFKGDVSRETLIKILKSNRLTIVQGLPGTPNGYMVKMSDSAFHEPFTLVDKLLATGMVDSAYPDTYMELEEFTIPPNDQMYLEQWHHTIVSLQAAWTRLRATNSPGVVIGNAGDKTYGDADLIIAIADSGIHTYTPPGGTPISAHHDFAGNVTSGNSKIYRSINFNGGAVVNDNDTPTSTHGMGCAGAALAKSNNPPMNGAIGEGIVGAAPNIRAMGVIRGGTVARIQNMFLWMSGLPTGNNTTPIPLLGADIASNSWGGAALGGFAALPQTTYRLMTSFGRKGRGIPIFFASGNGVNSPFAFDPLVIGVGASTLNQLPPILANEIIAPYSGSGTGVDTPGQMELVAPSHSNYAAFPAPSKDHNPNARFGAISTSLHSEGGTAGAGRLAQATIGVVTAAPLNRVTLAAGSTGFSSSMILVINPGAANASAHYIDNTNGLILSLATPVTAGLAIGTPVIAMMGNLPGSAAPVATSLTANTAVGNTRIQVADTSGLVPNQQIFFAVPGAPGYRARTIQRIHSHNHIILTANVGAVIVSGTAVTGATTVAPTVQSAHANIGPADSQFQASSILGIRLGQQLLIGPIGGATSELVTVVSTTPAAPPATPNPQIRVNPRLVNPHAPASQITVVGGRVATATAGIAAVATATTLTVQSTAGFQVGQAIFIGAVGGGAGNVDYNVVRSVPNATTLNLGRQLTNGHGAGTAVFGSSASYTMVFGGTSFSCPLTAGIAGLALSANPNLTWIEVRQILRQTAVRIQPAHASWAAIPATNILAGRFHSPNFGYGRVNASAAITAAIAYNHNQRDLVVRDSLVDNGRTATPPDTVINSPDIWIRNTNPTGEGAAVALPANLATAGPHQKPTRGADRWVYTRVSNQGNALQSLEAWLRVYIAISDGEPEFGFPNGWTNFGGMGNIATNSSNLYLLNPGVAPNLNGSPLYRAPMQANPAPGIPALTAGINSASSHTHWFRWPQAQIPTLPLSFRKVDTFSATVAVDTVIHLDNTMRMVPGQQLLFGLPGSPGHRARTIATVDHAAQVTLTAAIGRVFPANTPVISISPTIATTFKGIAAVGAGASSTFNVNDASNFNLGQHILLGNPGTAGTEIVAITNLTVNPAGDDNLTVTPANATAHADTRPITLISDPLRTFVVAEVNPHDGLLAGDTFRNNNNISFKEINLRADLAFMNQANNAALSNSVTVDEVGAAVTTNFRLNMVDPDGFTMENVSIKVTRHHTDPSNNETITFRFNPLPGPGAWGFDSVPAGGWLVANAPVQTVGGAAAAAAETNTFFTGTFQVDSNHNKVTFIAIHTPPAIPATQIIPIQVKYHEVVLFTLPPGTSNLGLTQSKKPKFHIWTDMAQINDQAVGDGYGPDSVAVNPDPLNKFNLTSLFTAAPANTVPAYATVTGTVFIQRNATDANKVNLFLKPLNQSKVGYTAVKYFVYRGLKLTDFLKGTSAADELKARANDATASAFIQYVYAVYDQLKVDAAAPAADLASKALGWDPPNQGTTTTSVDRYFYATDPNFQLPIVPIGMVLGNFHNASGKFGFEIILEEGIYSPDLANARRAQTLIDLLTGGLAPAQIKARREVILNYIDPAAYYGMHFQIGVETKDVGNRIKKENDLFLASMAKYITRDKVYIDIRNESGYSYNYYSNYDDGTGNQVQVGDDALTLVVAPYHTNSWPIIIHDANIPVAQTNTPVFLSLRVNDNKKPLVYVEWTELTTASKADKFVSGTDLNTAAGVTWTKPMGFATPNVIHPTDGTRRIHISQVVKLNYFRELDATTVWPTTVFETASHLANLFGPLEAPELFTAPADDIEWVSAQDKRFIDNSGAAAADKFAYVAERGVAQEDSRVIYWASASEQYDTAGGSYSHATGVTAGTSTKGNFFEVAYMFRGLRLEIVLIKEETAPTVFSEVRTLKLSTQIPNQMSAQNLMVLGITEAEATLLKAVIGFAPQHERNLVLVEVANSPFTDPDGKKFNKYRLRVAGLNPALNYFVDDPASNVFVYSTDGHFFCSKDFGTAQPDPVYYGPSMEEFIPDGFSEKTVPILALDAATETLVNDFTALAAAIPNDANAKSALTNLATTQMGLLWTQSVTFAHANQDNRPYFLARNKMRHELRRHPYFLGKNAERNAATTVLENLSRNYTGISYAGLGVGGKKILVVGMDTNALEYEIIDGSSITALALHGDNINSGATSGRIQSMVLPRRYSEYNANLIQTHFGNTLQNNTVDMIIMVSHDLTATTFNLERVAGRKRGGKFDNENQKDYTTVGNTAAFAQFYETNLPVVAMHPGPFPGAPGQWLYYNEAAESGDVTKNSPLASVSPGANGNANSYLLNTLTGDALFGSSGDYIPNEIFYRLCQLRSQHGSTVKVGMITIPPIADVVGGAITMTQAVQRVKDIITLALPSL